MKKFEPVPDATISLYDIIVDSSVSILEIEELEKWFYGRCIGIIVQVPITQEFVDYASKSEYLMKFLLRSGCIQEVKNQFEPYTIKLKITNFYEHNSLVLLSRMDLVKGVMCYKESNNIETHTNTDLLATTIQSALELIGMNRTFDE